MNPVLAARNAFVVRLPARMIGAPVAGINGLD
jgi:hypothetical protein